MNTTNDSPPYISIKKSNFFLLMLSLLGVIFLLAQKAFVTNNINPPLVPNEIAKASFAPNDESDTHNIEIRENLEPFDEKRGFVMPKCDFAGRPDDPTTTEILISVDASAYFEDYIYTELAKTKFNKKGIVIPPIDIFSKCFRENYLYDIDQEDFSPYFDYLCKVRHTLRKDLRQSHGNKVVYQQNLGIDIYDTKNRRVVYSIVPEAMTLHFTSADTPTSINLYAQKKLTNLLKNVSFPALKDPGTEEVE